MLGGKKRAENGSEHCSLFCGLQIEDVEKSSFGGNSIQNKWFLIDEHYAGSNPAWAA